MSEIQREFNGGEAGFRAFLRKKRGQELPRWEDSVITRIKGFFEYDETGNGRKKNIADVFADPKQFESLYQAYEEGNTSLGGSGTRQARISRRTGIAHRAVGSPIYHF